MTREKKKKSECGSTQYFSFKKCQRRKRSIIGKYSLPTVQRYYLSIRRHCDNHPTLSLRKSTVPDTTKLEFVIPCHRHRHPTSALPPQALWGRAGLLVGKQRGTGCLRVPGTVFPSRRFWIPRRSKWSLQILEPPVKEWVVDIARPLFAMGPLVLCRIRAPMWLPNCIRLSLHLRSIDITQIGFV